jgi:hypothetical protein
LRRHAAGVAVLLAVTDAAVVGAAVVAVAIGLLALGPVPRCFSSSAS